MHHNKKYSFYYLAQEEGYVAEFEHCVRHGIKCNNRHLESFALGMNNDKCYGVLLMNKTQLSSQEVIRHCNHAKAENSKIKSTDACRMSSKCDAPPMPEKSNPTRPHQTIHINIQQQIVNLKSENKKLKVGTVLACIAAVSLATTLGLKLGHVF